MDGSVDRCPNGHGVVRDGLRTPSCLAAESAARELRERAERPRYNCLGPECGYMKGKAFVEGFIEEVYQHLGLGQLASRTECMAAIDGLREENEKLRSQLAVVLGQQTMLHHLDMNASNDRFSGEATLSHPMVLLMAAECVQLFNQTPGAINFLSWRVTTPDCSDTFEIIVQRVDGKRPAEMVTELKASADKAESECATLRERLREAEGLLDMVACGCYRGHFGKMVSDIEAFLEPSTPEAPTVSKTETVAPAAVPELTEEEAKALDILYRLGPMHMASQLAWPRLRECARKGFAYRKDGFYALTPAGREALARDGQTPAIQAAVNEEVQKP